MPEFVAFTAGSALVVYVSRASLLAPHSHGFYRFFAWEAILALTLLNLRVWFHDPFSWHQLISWPLLVVAVFLVVDGVILLRQIGKQDSRRTDAPMLQFEKTTTLVEAGVYRYIRHPLYSSLLFLAWGIFFKAPSWPGCGLVGLATVFLIATARVEEAEDIRFFGAAYRAYMQCTRMFIPFLF